MEQSVMTSEELDVRVAELHAEGMGRRRIAHALGISPDSVRKRAARLGLPPQTSVGAWSEAERARVVEMWGAGAAVAEIAQALARPVYGTRRQIEILQTAGRIEPRKTHPRKPTAGKFTARLEAAAGEFGVPMELVFKMEKLRARSKKGMSRDFALREVLGLWNQQEGRCVYTGLEMDADSGPRSVSIDRVDSSRGYELDNVVLCCLAANWMKNELTVAQLVGLCAAVVQTRGGEFGVSLAEI